MKVLDFSDVKLYEMFYEGLCVSGTKGAETVKLGKVLTKLEEVGAEKGDERGLYTLAQDATIELEDAEHELVKRLINEVQWNGKAAKLAGTLIEFLEDAPTPEKKLKVMHGG